jgi:hypothetical protein
MKRGQVRMRSGIHRRSRFDRAYRVYRAGGQGSRGAHSAVSDSKELRVAQLIKKLCKLKVPYGNHKSPPLIPILNHNRTPHPF